MKDIKQNENNFEIDFEIEQNSKSHAQEKNLIEKCKEFLNQKFKNKNITLTMEVFEKQIEDKINTTEIEDDESWRQKRKFEIIEPVMLVGETLTENFAEYIKDQKTEKANVILAGKITSIKSYEIKKKQKDEEKVEPENDESLENNNEVSSENEKESYKRKFFSITLEDFTGDIKAKIFSTKENLHKLEKLDVGSAICVEGMIEFNDFSGVNILYITKLGYCSLPENFEEYIEYHKEKSYYEFVKPEQIIIYEQNNLMNFNQIEETPNYLKNKTFVCYDLETTGLHFENGDKMIEIGAIKIVNGKITEKFMSYIDPEKPIPKESSAISGIVDSDVVGAPKDYQVLQDFYKFTRNAVLIGYNNINFDNIFLLGQGKNCRWNFDNKTEDVYVFAQKFVKNAKNYKLGTIAKTLGVNLDNAHRAVYDALATAEIFLKLANKIE